MCYLIYKLNEKVVNWSLENNVENNLLLRKYLRNNLNFLTKELYLHDKNMNTFCGFQNLH